MNDDELIKLQKNWKSQNLNFDFVDMFQYTFKRNKQRKWERIVRTIVFILMIPVFLRINQALGPGMYFSEIGFTLLYISMVAILINNWKGAAGMELQPTSQFLKSSITFIMKLKRFYNVIMPILAIVIILGVNLILYEIFYYEPWPEKIWIFSLSTLILLFAFARGITLHVHRCNKEILRLTSKTFN